jgi:hypothetical protein
MSKRVAIIGAGPAGLAAAKAAEEAGLSPVVYERESTIGGVWCSTGAAWSGLTTNISRYTCAFSDHPWDEAVGDFPTRDDVLHYLHSYAASFGIVNCHCPSVGSSAFTSQLNRIRQSLPAPGGQRGKTRRLALIWRIGWIKSDNPADGLIFRLSVIAAPRQRSYPPPFPQPYHPTLKLFTVHSLHSQHTRS